MPGLFAIFSSKKLPRAQKEESAGVQMGELKLEESREGFVKVTQLQKGEDFFRGNSAYEAEVAKAQELSQLRELNRVRLITAKFEEIISSTSPTFLSTSRENQEFSQILEAHRAMEDAKEYAQRMVELEIVDIATHMIKNPKALQGLKRIQSFAKGLKAKKELNRLRKRAENRKLLLSTLSHVQGLIKSAVLDQNEHTGKVKLGTNQNARFQGEFEAYDPADTFDNPLAYEEDFMAKDYQAKFPLAERVAHAERLMNHKSEIKTLDQMVDEAKTKKEERAEVSKKMSKEERIQALISGNSFFSEMREPLEISVKNERFTVHSKPSVVLAGEFDAAFAELDAEA